MLWTEDDLSNFMWYSRGHNNSWNVIKIWSLILVTLTLIEFYTWFWFCSLCTHPKMSSMAGRGIEWLYLLVLSFCVYFHGYFSYQGMYVYDCAVCIELFIMIISYSFFFLSLPFSISSISSYGDTCQFNLVDKRAWWRNRLKEIKCQAMIMLG